MDDLRSATVTIAPATRRDAFAVAALHLQRDLAQGARPEPGFLDRFADWWLRESDRATWLATASGGDPVGALSAHVVDDGPRVGRGGDTWLYVSFLFVAPAHRAGDVPRRLISQAQSSCVQRGLTRVRVTPAAGLDEVLADHGFGAGAELSWSPRSAA